MNQGRIWCVVHPTVGLPLFLGGVATISLIVHASVLTNTTWMADFFNGGAPDRVSLNDTTAPVALASSQGQPAFVVTVAPAVTEDGKAGASFVVSVSPAATAGSAAVGGDPAVVSDRLALAVPDVD